MSLLKCLAVPAFATLGAQAVAGDASGFDPQVIRKCLAAAQTDGQRLDCAGQGQESCLAYTQKTHPDADPIDRQLNCLDAEAQAWDARLTQVYDALKDTQVSRGSERAEALVGMEREWIAFRDARCGYDKLTNGRGTGGILAQPRCLLHETARQVILLMAYQRDRT